MFFLIAQFFVAAIIINKFKEVNSEIHRALYFGVHKGSLKSMYRRRVLLVLAFILMFLAILINILF